MSRNWSIWLRSVRGQLSLLAVVFAGAVVLAVAAIALRGPLFEHYVRERYPPLEGWSEEAFKKLAAAKLSAADLEALDEGLRQRDGTTLDAKGQQDLERIYGAWIEQPEEDPSERLPGRLTRLRPEWVVQRLRRTLVAGRADQRARALRWMELVVGDSRVSDDLAALAEHAGRRSRARGEQDLYRLAQAVLANRPRVRNLPE